MKVGPVGLLTQTNTKGTILVASLHWRWSYTWRWGLWYSLPKRLIFHTQFFRTPRGTIVSLMTPLGTFRFQSQPSLPNYPEMQI